jgi:hypothetical protein
VGGRGLSCARLTNRQIAEAQIAEALVISERTAEGTWNTSATSWAQLEVADCRLGSQRNPPDRLRRDKGS